MLACSIVVCKHQDWSIRIELLIDGPTARGIPLENEIVGRMLICNHAYVVGEGQQLTIQSCRISLWVVVIPDPPQPQTLEVYKANPVNIRILRVLWA